MGSSTLAFTHLPHLTGLIRELSGFHNKYWGYQRLLLDVDKKNEWTLFRKKQDGVIQVEWDAAELLRKTEIQLEEVSTNLTVRI